MLKKQYGGNGDESEYSAFRSYNNFGVNDGYYLVLFSSSTDITSGAGQILVKYDLSGNIANTNIFSENIYWVVYSINNYAPSGIQNGLIFVSRVDEGLLQLKFSYPTYDIVKETTEKGTISVDNNATAGEGVKDSRITNPNTVSACLTILAIIVLMYLGTFLVLKHEKKNITEN